MDDILTIENIPATKIAVESRLITNVNHIYNALALVDIDETQKSYIQDQLKRISLLADKLMTL